MMYIAAYQAPIYRSICILLIFAFTLAGCTPSRAPVTPISAVHAPVETPTVQPTFTISPPVIATSTPIPITAPAPTPTNIPAPSVITLPAPHASLQVAPWRFAVFGDVRTYGLYPPAVTYQIVARAKRAEPEVALVVGDLINAADTEIEIREQWRNWLEAFAPLRVTHMLVTPGNHDVQGSKLATTLMQEAFPGLPSNGPPGFERRTYAIDYKGVRFISVDSEIFGNPHRLGEAQLQWLERTLKENQQPYIIVFSHDPAYPVGPHKGNSLDVYPEERNRFWALLKQYRVTAFIAGHEHLYNHQVIDDVHQIISGTSGSYPYSGYGGDFWHYLICEVRSEGIEVVLYSPLGQERERYVIRPGGK